MSSDSNESDQSQSSHRGVNAFCVCDRNSVGTDEESQSEISPETDSGVTIYERFEEDPYEEDAFNCVNYFDYDLDAALPNLEVMSYNNSDDDDTNTCSGGADSLTDSNKGDSDSEIDHLDLRNVGWDTDEDISEIKKNMSPNQCMFEMSDDDDDDGGCKTGAI